MRGKRLYITIPRRDYYLVQRYGVLVGQCSGQVARAWVLANLYRLLECESELRDYDAQLAYEERQEAIRGR